MFRPEPRIPFVPALREQVLAIVGSINQPQVSVPGKAAEPAAGHACALRNGNGTISVFVGFHLLLSGANVIYVSDPPQLQPAARARAMEEAVQLLESMGFMVDDLRFGALAPEAQEDLLRRIPMFTPPTKPAAAAPAAPTGPEAALGRLLASF